MIDEWQLPRRPFFSCSESAFSIIDGELMRHELLSGVVTPAIALEVGTGNIFEHRPRRVTEHRGQVVSVLCDDNSTVVLDFENGTARKRTPAGDQVYRAGIEEGNAGRGYMPR